MGKNDAIGYLSVPSWENHQETRTRDGKVWRPPWIKVRCDNSDDYAYSQLTIRQRGLLVEIWKLAGRLENHIPHDPKWISKAIFATEDIRDDLEKLISRGFVSSSVKVTDTSRKGSRLEVEKEVEKESPNGDTRKVFEHWQRARGKERSRLTDGRRAKIQARLRSFSVEDLVRAVDAVALDPWEDRTRHDDLTIVFRNDEQVEKFLALADDPPRANGFVPTATLLGAQ